MNKPWRVDVLQCRGSSYEVGKQMAEDFLKTTRGATFHSRRGHQPFGFDLNDAQAALRTYAPNIWEELHRLAGENSLKNPARAGRCPILERPPELSQARMFLSHG